ncbi:hypothetical protein Kkor_0504 [Kangiella koreensis DSM 16069]|uniref:Uncharacterized protein n=1 Tax=Kangiella koreensis (strain DSM 16069 / JCM 12317 / KCTC 12182 / SW-125) TaxID=523791 RepID=C7R8R1_KANKD|nr:hypothetical protein Kkor_0504 [Kangiella koreensis DSM 16069]
MVSVLKVRKRFIKDEFFEWVIRSISCRYGTAYCSHNGKRLKTAS